VGRSGAVRAGEASFLEERRVVNATTLKLRRASRLPLMRVAPADYQRVAAQLRAVDSLEQGEIRIAVPVE
jgi:hypothetical protein